jgi:hypothetical protein
MTTLANQVSNLNKHQAFELNRQVSYTSQSYKGMGDHVR